MGDISVEEFIARWSESGGSELANSQQFLIELCGLLGVDPPDPTKPEVEQNTYAFERQVTFCHADGTTSKGRIDLYKLGCFVLESKQGTLRTETSRPLARLIPTRPTRTGTAIRHTRGWDEAMLRAFGQAQNYVRNLPAKEGRPPFIIVVDVGHSIELFSEFSMSGGAYVPYPDPQSHRIFMQDLTRPEVQERLRLVWSNPLSLDPTRRSARVTREIASNLAELAKSLEQSGNRPQDVAQFLMRCLFTMFAEDVGLLPAGGFTKLLTKVEGEPKHFKPMAQDLWHQMKTGGFSSFLMEEILHFNGYLFADAMALDLDADQIQLLKQAAKADWKDVEPSIFGTLLERALNPAERHKLGAHFTPRAYVERLVMPTIVEPLREEWDAVKAAVVNLSRQDDEKKAVAELETFHQRLCRVRILDPACGSGNFLYVSLEHLKRLEGEVLEMLEKFGQRQTALEMGIERTVDPHQFLGLELNPRAAAIAELVLWIGYLQWHFRTHGQTNPPEPIIRDFKNIECRDAVLAYKGTRPVLDDDGKPVTRWDGRTSKKSSVTGDDVPDENARVLVEEYLEPAKATWPKADFVVGNPPFLGISPMRQAMGDGYAETIRNVYEDIPGSCDYVLYWWNQAAHLARQGHIRRFGFITTNSMRQTLNRRLIEKHLAAKPPLSIVFAVPDHPWVDSADGAAVRIAMTVGEGGEHNGLLQTVVHEEKCGEEERLLDFAEKRGKLQADLTIGPEVAGAKILQCNKGVCFRGVTLAGKAFVVDSSLARELGKGRIENLEKHIVPYFCGKDLTGINKKLEVIDLFGLSIEDVEHNFPEVFQRILNYIKPERDQNNRASYRDNWWIFAEPRSVFRSSRLGLKRFVATPRTAKHRFFVFLQNDSLPESEVIAITIEDGAILGVLSSRIHIVWTLAQGGTLEDRPRYNNSRCFETFPFPDPPEVVKERIRDLGERLDAHRKRQQELHPGLTMTGMYNVLEKLKSGEELTTKEKEIHEQGLVSLLKQIHEELDQAVFEAYGWPADLNDEEILERLVELNKQRAAEEAKGLIRWLRPEYQAPEAQPHTQVELIDTGKTAKPQAAKIKKQPWPKAMAEQAKAVRRTLELLEAPADVETVAKCFTRAKRDRVAELLETLASLGQARALPGETYEAA